MVRTAGWLFQWGKSAYNTMWCLIGCSIGDLGTIAAFQFVFTDSGWSTMNIMMLAMFNGIMTSIILETIILSKQMILKEAFKVAIGMSLISMIGMEAAMNIVDYLLTDVSISWIVSEVMHFQRCHVDMVGYSNNAVCWIYYSLAIQLLAS